MSYSHQDWNYITFDKRGERKKNESKEQQIQRLRRTDPTQVKTTKTTHSNKSIIGQGAPSIRKIEKEEDTFKLPTVSKTMASKIAQARCVKKLSQKELAMQLALPIKIIKDYETATAIPNHLIINKLEKILETRLRD